MRIKLLVFLFLIVPAIALSQVVVKNPTLLTFVSVDWETIDRHELDILLSSDNSFVQTLVDTGPYTSRDISVGINVMPVSFGEYIFVARACVGTTCSVNSDPSNLWERVPGKPSKPDAQ